MLNRWLGLSALVIVLDQLSKAWVISHFAFGETFTVLSVFNLVLAHNTGAAFSFLNDAGGIQRWLFSIIAVAASVWIVWLLRKHHRQLLFSWALSMI
ncbi:MAG: signal peptidase II, partial [Gallionella sp.]